MGTTIKERRSQIKLDKLASSLNIQYFNFKRNNFQKNFKTYKEVVQKCRKYRTPFICEFEVRTEGSYKKKNNLVKYHHGPMKLEMKNKFLLKDYKDDILYKISSKK